MKIWELIIGPNPFKAQQDQLDSEENNVAQKKKDLAVRKAQATLTKALKKRSEAATTIQA